MVIAHTPHTVDQALAKLKACAVPERLAGMARYAIDVSASLGVSMPEIRAIAKQISRDPALADALWQTGIHEARILASLVDDPKALSEEKMARWVEDFASWDVCDQVCGNLFDKHEKALEISRKWIDREEEFIKRAGFVVPTWHCVHHKKVPDNTYLPYLALIEREAGDPRNFVKKAVNWSLRQFGKRSANLHGPALELAQNLANSDDKTARWIGADAVRELDGDKIRARLGV